MFADSMFASAVGESTWANQSRRGWSTVISFAMQAVGISCLIALPLIYNQKLPQMTSLVPVIAPQLSPAPVRQQAVPVGNQALRNAARLFVSQGGRPRTFTFSSTENIAPPMGPIGQTCWSNCSNAIATGPWIPGAGSGGGANVVIPPPPPSFHETRRSVMMEGSLIHRVDPPYPTLARSMGVQGMVVLTAIVTRQGTVEHVRIVSGHPLLVKAARDAVLQWRYRPYVLNGEAIEVDTQITVNFILGHR